jgi:hypothetical protein
MIGVLMAHHPMVLSGFRRIQTDIGDSRLLHYILEHGYLWVRRAPTHQEFWSPPFFHPTPNVASYSDTLLSTGPVYWLWREMGASPDLSFGLWMVSMSVLNYAAGLLLFTRGLGFGIPAGITGAFLVAFGAPRVNEMGHQQLLLCFYILIYVYGFARLCGQPALSRWSRLSHWLLVAAASVAQLYCGVYLGWFLIMGIGVATAGALGLRLCRRRVLAVLRADWCAILVAGVVAWLSLLPFLAHYLPKAREVLTPNYALQELLHPRIWSWLNIGENSWLWGWASRLGHDSAIPFYDEHRLGMGFVTPLMCALGFYLGRQRPLCRLAALVVFLTRLATTYLPRDTFAVLAVGVVYVCLAGLFQDGVDWRKRACSLAVVIGLLGLIRFPGPYLQILWLMTVVLCLRQLHRARGQAVEQLGSALALGVISLALFTVLVLSIGAALVAPIAGLLAYFRPRERWEAGIGALMLVFLFAAFVTFFDQPVVLAGGLAAAPVALTMSAPRRFRRADQLLKALLLAVPFLIFFYHRNSLWIGYSGSIPGAVAIRAVGRVVLLLLIPAGFGLAELIEYLHRKQQTIVAGLIAVTCMAEQGVTTSSFDAGTNRATIVRLARQVERGRSAFYYLPCAEQPVYRYNLDAMWASLQCGVPTINGYSGYFPRGWEGFITVYAEDYPGPAESLDLWERRSGLAPVQVQWIGADCPPIKKKRR